MGAGRGQTRRGNAASQPRPKVAAATAWHGNVPRDAANAWVAFVDSNGLAEMSIIEYYGQDPTTPEGITAITYEMLKDLVTIGAVTLPPGASVNGIVPKISVGWEHEEALEGEDVIILTTQNPRARRRKAIVGETNTYFELLPSNVTLGSLNSTWLAGTIAKAVNALFLLSEDPAQMVQM